LAGCFTPCACAARYHETQPEKTVLLLTGIVPGCSDK
jgi:hypothetical protein